ncbi:4'-phosphopantetheinyl transferase family protein [Aspergillus undulatus]|uniref:4'-phosphopantetheinyl transferase family protein n=1 Tax=Aspergillus undulatus TaxID=1810928 RepID=UPI003CCDA3EF
MAGDTPTSILTRWYIDTRPLTSTTSTLPLLHTLQHTDQISVQKYYHLKDKHMSLASNLLKYLFVHRTCRVPWSSIVISRTPDPHRRPFYIHPSKDSDYREGGIEPINVEFNVSHQASMVAIAGTTIPSPPPSLSPSPAAPSTASINSTPLVGIDITCINERAGRTNEIRTLDSLHNYIDIFAEVFSAREIRDMKSLHGAPSPSSSSLSNDDLVDYGYRLFYTYWALKEAYIKMTGEALLAPWLRELEFSNVVAPSPSRQSEEGEGMFGVPYTGVKTTMNGDAVQDVRIEVVALEGDYLFATAARGANLGFGSGLRSEGNSDSAVGGGGDPWMPFQKLDIERDIRPCATGVCSCLS